MQTLSELPELTANESTLLENLVEQAENYIRNEPLTGHSVDDGFYYDYGSITGAWHSVPAMEYTPEDWGYIELELDGEQIRDYILDHLVEWASDYWPAIDYDTYDRSCDEPMNRRANVKWHWEKNKEKIFLVCELPG